MSKLIGIFERPELNFAANRAEDDDILGDAYEYLMRHFAAESGKSKGQFYTPAEVSRLIARVLLSLSDTKPRNNTTFYDPTCGSGSLLLRISAEADGKGTLYGQEKDNSTAALSRMNMILHNMATAEIKADNTLTKPQFIEGDRLKLFDYVVANPPFSDKGWSTGVQPANDPYGRFEMGIPPHRQGDYAYLLHIVHSLKPRGKGACILPHGVLFRGNAEAAIRKQLLKRGYIRAIIGLPQICFMARAFRHVSFCWIKKTPGRDAACFCKCLHRFVKDGNKNRLREMDIRRIADAIAANKDIPRYARMVSLNEIVGNDYNLNIPRYIDNRPPENLQNIDGHLHGGVPAADIESLANEFPIFARMQGRIIKSLRTGYYTPFASLEDIPATVVSDPDFQKFSKQMKAHFNKWQREQVNALYKLKKNCRPKKIIAELGGSILKHYQSQAKQIDPYRAYQHLMEFWNDDMEDDCYLIAANGWLAKPEAIMENGKEVGWECDLLPKALIISLYFADKQQVIDSMCEQAESLDASRVELEEKHGGEDGFMMSWKKLIERV